METIYFLVKAHQGREGEYAAFIPNMEFQFDVSEIVREHIWKTKTESVWERVKAARRIERPSAGDYMTYIFEHFVEAHGDRCFGDDPAVTGGIGFLDGQPVTVIAEQKGKDLRECQRRNYGMPRPEGYRKAFGYIKHPFTGVDYVDYYKGLIEEEGAEADIVFANHPEAIVKFAKNVLCCDIHTRERSKRRIAAAGAEKVLTTAEILDAPVNGSGYNDSFGLLGSNKATETTVKLFPKNAQKVAEDIQKEMLARTGVKVEAMIYGDGAFKDPVGKIWELADPVVGAGYTDGLDGLPNELKLKYLADNDFADLSGEELANAIRRRIQEKEQNLKGQMVSEGTTPRRLTDLIGSLCDLTSGSGDKGTPIVLVQNYFNNFAD